MCLRGRCECSHLFVSHMDPLDITATADDVSQPIQAIANDAINAFHSGFYQCFDELICDRLRHFGYS